MHLSDSTLRELVAMICQTTLERGAEQLPEPLAVAGQTGYLTACVQIAGTWQGAVTIACSDAFARQTASAMFALAPESVTVADARDALGELTNILGGNLKSILPGPSFLSLPIVADGSNHALRVLESRVLLEESYQCDGLPFHIAVLEGLPETA